MYSQDVFIYIGLSMCMRGDMVLPVLWDANDQSTLSKEKMA